MEINSNSCFPGILFVVTIFVQNFPEMDMPPFESQPKR